MLGVGEVLAEGQADLAILRLPDGLEEDHVLVGADLAIWPIGGGGSGTEDGGLGAALLWRAERSRLLAAAQATAGREVQVHEHEQQAHNAPQQGREASAEGLPVWLGVVDRHVDFAQPTEIVGAVDGQAHVDP